MSVGPRSAVERRRAGRRRLARWRYPYQPQPKQLTAHQRWADERLYGGAAGGGKTEWLLAEVVAACLRWPGLNAAIFRRLYRDLYRADGIIARLLDRLPPQIATWNGGTHQWAFRNGSTLELGAVERDTDVAKFQGAEYGVIGFDQVEHFTEFQYRYLVGSRLRVKAELEAAGFRPYVCATANPGNIGHAWVKARWIDPAPPGVTWQPTGNEDELDPGTRVFIPATVDDNRYVGASYLRRLDSLPEDDRRALRYGDWDVYAGQRFRDFRRHVHVRDPEELDLPLGGITRAIGIDYGFDAPFAALWGARLADNLVVVYRELYTPGLVPEEQAAAILASMPRGERRRIGPAFIDPSTWARSLPGKGHVEADVDDTRVPPPGSIARSYYDAGLPTVKAGNDRLLGVARVADALRVRPDGMPRLIVSSQCRNLIRTLPQLVRDPKRPEDVLKGSEDHAYDALRYLLLGLDAVGGPGHVEPDVDEPGGRRRRRTSRTERIDSTMGDLHRVDFELDGWPIAA